MLKQLSGFVVISASALALSGCLFGQHGYIHDRQQDYLQSKSAPALKIPANLNTAPMTSNLPIPAGNDFSKTSVPPLVPPGDANVALLQANQTAEKQAAASVKSNIGQGADGFPVLKMSSPYKASWYKLNKTVTTLGYQIIGSDQKTGVVDVMSPADKNTLSEIYQLKATAGSSGTLITVLDQTGNAVDAKVSQALLEKLQTELGK